MQIVLSVGCNDVSLMDHEQETTSFQSGASRLSPKKNVTVFGAPEQVSAAGKIMTGDI